MARASSKKRPKNREVENEMIRPPERPGEPPRPATEPAEPAKSHPKSARRPASVERGRGPGD